MFEINDSLDVKVFQHKGRSAVIIDDFYKNPDEIRKLALSEPISDDEHLVSGFPGWRVFKKTNIGQHLYDLFLDLATDNDIWNKEYIVLFVLDKLLRLLYYW